MKIATQRVTLQVADGTSMNAYTARPAEEGKFPGILVFQEAFGVNAHIRDITERIAREGYVAIAPELFHRTAPGFEGSYTDRAAIMPHMQAMKEEGTSRGHRSSLRLAENPSRRRCPTASRASDSAWEAACRFWRPPRFRCGRRFPSMEAASRRLCFPGRRIFPRRCCSSGAVSTSTSRRNKSAPLTDELKRVGKTYVNVEISDADHGFFCDARESYNPTAAALAWTLSLKFLDIHVNGRAEGPGSLTFGRRPAPAPVESAHRAHSKHSDQAKNWPMLRNFW